MSKKLLRLFRRKPKVIDFWDCSHLHLNELPREVLEHRHTLRALYINMNSIRDFPRVRESLIETYRLLSFGVWGEFFLAHGGLISSELWSWKEGANWCRGVVVFYGPWLRKCVVTEITWAVVWRIVSSWSFLFVSPLSPHVWLFTCACFASLRYMNYFVIKAGMLLNYVNCIHICVSVMFNVLELV